MNAFLEIQAVSKSYGTQKVLDEVSLSVQSGEFLTILGPSGSGKTTLLRLLGGFETGDSGRISLEGIDISSFPPNKRRINTVFQNYALFPHLNVRENVAFGLRNLGLREAEIDQQLDTVLGMVQLKGYENRLPEQLSGGQQQRVALARALVMRPAILLLDEPFAALDPKLRSQMQGEMKILQRNVGVTFLLVTHDQGEALRLSDRIAVLNRGKLEQIGRPNEIYDVPTTQFVADFMGVQNIFPIDMIQIVEQGFLCRLGSGIEVLTTANTVSRNTAKYVAIRPTRISISNKRPEGPVDNLRQGKIVDMTYRGDSRNWKIVDCSGECWIVEEPVRERQSSSHLSLRDEIYFWWGRENAVLIS